MLDLTIIIVNYNVRHFLEQCLISVKKALEGIPAEIIVVDNNSVDGSQQMLRDKFADDIIFIENKDNTGFSKANNQGIEIANGRYVLLLNPDTIVEESTFRKCLDYMDTHKDVGALGVRMIDGQGHFLPESKRSLPTPWVSFYKIFGLSSLFPKNKKFGKYHLTYLDSHETHEVEILSGAYMWLRKDVLDKIGHLDETFFMYGEDIDLSYRVIQAGYKNVYFADTQIIHYKGESTKKGSLNYVKVFYQAMIIFARKHFGGNSKRLFIAAIRLAVYMRASIAIVNRLVKKLGFPLLEALLIYVAMFGIKTYWEHYVKYIVGGVYPKEFTLIYLPAYAILFVVYLWLAGAYKKPYRLRPLIMAPFWAFITIATVTYMFDAIMNFSRGIVGLSSIFTMLIAITTRGAINLGERGSFFFTENSEKRVLIVGEEESIRRVMSLIRGELDYPVEVVGGVSEKAQSGTIADCELLGTPQQLKELIRFYDIQEIIFCNQDFSTQKILDMMVAVQNSDVAYKILPPGADYLVGPQVIHSSRYSRQVQYKLQQRSAKTSKQIFDLVSSALLLVSFPLLFWLYKKPGKALGRLLKVVGRQYHMVGYIHPESTDLPVIKPGLLNMLHRAGDSDETKRMNTSGLDKYYARSYNWDLDLEILLKGWREIG